MNWRRVRLIFMREIRDQLRDRRTLFMIAVLPLLLYPALGIGLFQMTLLLRQEQQTVVVLNSQALPGPPLIEEDRFAANWFAASENPDHLRVVTPGAKGEEDTPADQTARKLATIQSQFEEITKQKEAAQANGNSPAVRKADQTLKQLAHRRGVLFEQSGFQVLLIVPPDLKRQFKILNEHFRADEPSAKALELPAPTFLYNVASEEGRIAFSRVKEIYGQWKNAALARQLQQIGLSPRFATVLDAEVVDVAGQEEHARSIWSKLLPAMLVIMTLTGAFYPAVDLAAGEKERGTMETLLICPASRAEIVAGKFLTIAAFAICTALLNLISLGLTGQYLASAALSGGGLDALQGLLMPPFLSLIWVGVLLLPIAALFSAVCLALATFARGTKEGQYYLTPILLVTIGLTMFAQMPTVELNPLNSVLPISGVVLLLKAFLEGETPYAYLAPVLFTSVGYAAIAIWWAVEQFRREDVLFREAEQFEPRLWLRKLLRDKPLVPSFGAAGFCFLLIMILQFVAMRIFAGALTGDSTTSPGASMARLLILQQVLIIAAPALILGLLFTSSPRATFRWRWPRAKFWIIGFLLPLALMPLSATLAEWTAWFFPELPESIVKVLSLMSTDEVPIAVLLLAFAVAPAICEELAFRGFILSGFSRARHQWLAIALSSFAFGLMHMIPQQAFNAALLGLVLGLIAIRSRSLWPCVLFHMLFNGATVLQQRYAASMLENGYPWWLLTGCLIIAATLITWLLATPRHDPAKIETQSSSSPNLPETESRQPV